MALPQLDGETVITDGGMETTLIFEQGIELPCFATFPLLDDEAGSEALRRYFDPYLAIAREHDVAIMLDAPTWRANPDWGARLGYSAESLDGVNRRGVELLEEIRAASGGTTVVVSGAVGPRGDAYRTDGVMTADEAEAYHRPQIEAFADTSADLVAALTLAYPEEAVGIARASHAADIPCVISFTLEVDGRLPSGDTLREATGRVDDETDGAPAFYMVNCAYPTHIAPALREPGPWLERIGGIRANASAKSHAELDESDELDAGDPAMLAAGMAALRASLPNLKVIGGCCGTDHRHVAQLCETWLRAT